MQNEEILRRLGVALAIGLLIGLERGWEARELAEGQRFAGFRTFAIVSLLGGIAAIAAPDSPAVMVAVFIALGMVATAGYWRTSSTSEDLSATTAVAMLLTFGLGALAGHGYLAPAASTAVVVTILLGLKPELHAVVQRLERQELLATLRLLLISVVMLPVLPDRGYGPWEVLNPYRIWWMVVLVASLSYVGYFAIKLFGNRSGSLVTGLFGGLASSTATAIELAEQGKQSPDNQKLLASSIVIASAVMFPRMLIVSAINPKLLPSLAPPLLVAGAVALGIGMWRLWQSGGEDHKQAELRTSNPLDLWTATQFGLILAVVMILARAAVAIASDRGVYVVAALSGLADVDAITLSLATMASHGQVSATAAFTGILIAGTVNTLFKPAAVVFVCGLKMGRRVAWPLIVALVTGLGAVLMSGLVR